MPTEWLSQMRKNNDSLKNNKYGRICFASSDLDGGGAGAQAWWEAPCADIEALEGGWPMMSLVFLRIINIYDVIL